MMATIVYNLTDEYTVGFTTTAQNWRVIDTAGDSP